MSLAEMLAGREMPFDDRAGAIRDALRDAIIDRRLSPGAKLVEAEIGELFSVSRTVVRSALQMLVFEGLIRNERNRGAFISSPSPDEARQVFAARRLIEPGIVITAVDRRTPDDIEAFQAHLATEEGLVHQLGPLARRAEIRASGAFHLLLAKVGGNAVLLKFMEELIARSSLVVALYGTTGTSRCGHDEHRAIVDALIERNIEKANKLIHQHINHIEGDLDLRIRDSLALKDALFQIS